MTRLQMSVPHTLSQQEAIDRIKALLQNVKIEHSDKVSDLREEWTGNVGQLSGSAMGFSVSGTVVVTPTHVEISGNLPFAASFFKSKIESTIRDRATELLA